MGLGDPVKRSRTGLCVVGFLRAFEVQKDAGNLQKEVS